MYFLWVAKQEIANSQRFVEAARRGGAWLLTRMESTPTGARWARGPDTDGIHENQYFPTFCCGTAGVSYFLATLSQVICFKIHHFSTKKIFEQIPSNAWFWTRNETASNLISSTRFIALSKRLGRKRCCDTHRTANWRVVVSLSLLRIVK